MKLATLKALSEGDFENALIAATPGGIEAQEAAGQRDFVTNDTLPIKCNSCSREQLEQMGIEFGERGLLPVDALFVEVRLPDGWRKEPTSHSMWSKLIDEKGRERANIFYKAAFYDRDAFIGIKRRFSCCVQPHGGYESPDYDYETAPRVAVVTDQDIVIWQSEAEEISKDVPTYEAAQRFLPDARKWLESLYPDWKNPLAYWDLD